ncbi:MAG: hypothetical protein OEU26_08645, partial [Candidatus Tectomicrobia bacterium]|nr:hypothetical protein [Candidatus Tectomicrobia bacterium]
PSLLHVRLMQLPLGNTGKATLAVMTMSMTPSIYDASDRVTLATTFSCNLDREKGFRRKGNLLRIGLTSRAISKINARLRQLLERVVNGEIQLF